MLNNEIIPELRAAYREHFHQILWLRDVALAHRTNIIKTRLSGAFNHRIIGIGIDTEWSARSPDITPCEYFLLVHVKNQVAIFNSSYRFVRFEKSYHSCFQRTERQSQLNQKGNDIYERKSLMLH